MTIGDRFSMYEYNTRSELVAANRYFGSDTNDTSNPVGLQDWFYNYDNIGNRTQAEKSGAYSGYTANALNQLVLHSQEPKGEGEVGYTQRTVPGSTDVTGSAETNVTVTVNNQAVNRQDKYWSKRLDLDNSESTLYEGLNILGVYNPPGTNDPDIVTSVTGNVFVAETPEQFTYDDDPASPRWLRGTGSKLLSDGRFSYTWDGDPASPKWLRGTGGRLIAVETLPDLPLDVPVVHVAFDYDYMSRRVGKHVYEWDDGTTNWNLTAETSFLYDNWNLVGSSEISNFQSQIQTNNSWFVWGLDLSGSLSGAGGIGGLLTSISGTNAVCYTYDANGNVSEMLSALSSELSILAHYEYSPFGETIVATGELAKENPYRFSTKYTDDETKLVYYGYRFLSPDMGRWINRDPILDGGFRVINSDMAVRLALNLFDSWEADTDNYKNYGTVMSADIYLMEYSGVNIIVSMNNAPVMNVDFLGLETRPGDKCSNICTVQTLTYTEYSRRSYLDCFKKKQKRTCRMRVHCRKAIVFKGPFWLPRGKKECGPWLDM